MSTTENPPTAKSKDRTPDPVVVDDLATGAEAETDDLGEDVGGSAATEPGAGATDASARSDAPTTTTRKPPPPATGDGDDGEDVGWDEDSWDEGDSWDSAVVRPPTKSRRQKRKEWRQSEKARRYAARRSVRFPIFTRAVLLWMLLFAMVGMAAGGSAAYFWAHFNTQIDELREQTRDFDKRSQDAQAQLDAMRNQALTDISQHLQPVAGVLAEAQTTQLSQLFSPYVWFVATLDENGEPSVGTAFPVASDDQATLLVTSLNTVRAASVNPAPDIELRKSTTGGFDTMKAKVVNYDADRDLALLQTPRGGMPVLDWATDEVQASAQGKRIFVASGFGGAGASLTSGLISDQSTAGFLHTALIGTYAQGAPIVTADAKVLGVASLTYKPMGFDPGEVHMSISVNQTCLELLECGGGARRAKAAKQPPPPAKK